MRRLLPTLLLTLGLLCATGALSAPVSADPATPTDAAAEPAPAGSDRLAAPSEASAAEVPAAPAVDAVSGADPAPSNGELLRDAGAVVEAVRAARAEGDDAQRALLWMTALASFLWLVIGLLRRLALLSKRASRWIPLATAGVGVIAAVVAERATGVGWGAALVVGAGAPLSVFLHELWARLPWGAKAAA